LKFIYRVTAKENRIYDVGPYATFAEAFDKCEAAIKRNKVVGGPYEVPDDYTLKRR
jgi:hypothetical protein